MRARHWVVGLVVALAAGLTGCGKAEPPAPPAPIQSCKDQELLNKVTGILAKAQDFPIEDMKPEMRLTEDLGINGPARALIRMDFENAFGIKIFDEEIAKARTVSELAALVEQKVKAKK